jgi:hypothetical protein
LILDKSIRSYTKDLPASGIMDFGFAKTACPFPPIFVNGQWQEDPRAANFRTSQDAALNTLNAASNPFTEFLASTVLNVEENESSIVPGVLYRSKTGKVILYNNPNSRDARISDFRNTKGNLICYNGMIINRNNVEIKRLSGNGEFGFAGFIMSQDGNIEAREVNYSNNPYFSAAWINTGSGSSFTLNVLPEPHLVARGNFSVKKVQPGQTTTPMY